MIRSLVIALALLGIVPSAQSQAEEEKQKIEIFMQQQEREDGSYRFYMWVHGDDVIVENSAPNIDVGFSFGGGAGVYLESEDVGNAMFIVHPYNPKHRWFSTRIRFGGSRPSDIHIYLPKNTEASVQVSTISYTAPKPEDGCICPPWKSEEPPYFDQK